MLSNLLNKLQIRRLRILWIVMGALLLVAVTPLWLYHRQALRLSEEKLQDTERVQQSEITRLLATRSAPIALPQEPATPDANAVPGQPAQRPLLHLSVSRMWMPVITLISPGCSDQGRRDLYVLIAVLEDRLGPMWLSIYPDDLDCSDYF